MRRPRNTEREQYVASKQARYLGMDPKDVLGLIDRKGGDYYRSDLFSDQGVMRQAEDDYSTFRSGTPAMNQVADDMRSYYGVGNSQVMTNLPPEIATQVAAVSEPYVKPQVARVTKPQVKPQPATTQEPQPMRKGLMDNLRKAGDAVGRFAKGQVEDLGRDLGDLDARYAQAVDKRFGLSAPGAGIGKNMIGLTSAAPIRDVFAPGQADTAVEKAMLMGMDAGVLATNVASRYALPAAGVTLAGKGLYDLTQMMMGQQTTGTISPE